MPIYEYQCQACHHSLEALQGLSEPALMDCPACQGKTLQRLVSAAGFQLKGTGWYATDFRNAGKPKAPPAATKETPAASTGGESTSSSSGSGEGSSSGKTGTES